MSNKEIIIHDPAIRRLLIALKDMPERLAKKEREYYERKAFVRKVFAKAVEDALGIKAKEDGAEKSKL